jgi:hypothetical protein
MKIYTSRKERNTRKEGTGKRQDWVEEETRVYKKGEETGAEREETVVVGKEPGVEGEETGAL